MAMTTSRETACGPCRRTVVATLTAAGCAIALTACGAGDDTDSSEPAGAREPDGDAAAEGSVLASTSDIPVGGGKIFKDAGVVVTQPAKGEFKAFSNRCTHKGCLVSGVSDGTVNCPCHGSKFDVADGSVRGGPAPEPLPAARITVAGGSIRLA